jgi:WD40 repeat protein
MSAGTNADTIHLFDVSDPRDSKTLSTGHINRINTARYSNDGQWILTAGNDHKVHLLHRTSAPLIKSLTSMETPVTSANFSPDNQSLILTTSGGMIEIWSQKSPKPKVGIAEPAIDDEFIREHTTSMPTAEITWGEFSPDQSAYLTCATNGEIIVWEAKTHQRLATIVAFPDSYLRAHFTRDSHHLIFGAGHNFVSVWRLRPQSHQLQKELLGDENE